MSTDKYPLPAHACSIWAAGDNLMVAFPGTVSEQGHTIKLPLSEGGLRAVISILRERSTAQDLRLSQRGTPSQWEADKLAAWGRAIKADRDQRIAELDAKRAAAAAEAREADEFLKELGL